MRRVPRALLSLAVGGTALATILSLSAHPVTTRVLGAQSTAGTEQPAGERSEEPTLVGERVQGYESALPQPTAEERRSVEMVNAERAKRGLSRLVIDPLLIEVAREHSAEMRDKSYFNHHSPTAGIKTPMDRYLKAVYSRPGYACVGENLFYCSITDVQRGHTAFMNSPTHRENVLFPRYEKIGVGIVRNDRGEFWLTQMYLTNTDPTLIAKKMSKR
jgi:uncharacterized protein YkwD